MVFYRQADNRAVKCTYPGSYGMANGSNGRTRKASPLYYLQRLELMNHEFGADVRVEGIMLDRPRYSKAEDELFPSIVTSQEWVRAADPVDPHPSEQQISSLMASLGFSKLDNSIYRWCREDGVVVFDAKPDNFISSTEGIVPIDLIIGREFLAESG